MKSFSVKNHIKGSRERFGLLDGIILLILVPLSVSFVYPFWNIYITAFNQSSDTIRGALYLWPRAFTLDNFKYAFAVSGIEQAAVITVAHTFIGTVTHVLSCALLGFVLTKKEVPGIKFFSFFFFLTMLIYGGTIPNFLLIKDLGLLDNFMVYIIPGLLGFWDVALIRAFIETLPPSLQESAEIDGASVWVVFFRIILPLIGPILATIGLFTAVAHWNDWFTGVYYLPRAKNLWPLQTILQKMIYEMESFVKQSQGASSSEYLRQMTSKITPSSVRIATLVISVTPIILVYPFVQKYFVKGILLGSVKE
jgi:putative aldouronate transport system permease protein